MIQLDKLNEQSPAQNFKWYNNTIQSWDLSIAYRSSFGRFVDLSITSTLKIITNLYKAVFDEDQDSIDELIKEMQYFSTGSSRLIHLHDELESAHDVINIPRLQFHFYLDNYIYAYDSIAKDKRVQTIKMSSRLREKYINMIKHSLTTQSLLLPLEEELHNREQLLKQIELAYKRTRRGRSKKSILQSLERLAKNYQTTLSNIERSARQSILWKPRIGSGFTHSLLNNLQEISRRAHFT
jgi:hypothetical protein